MEATKALAAGMQVTPTVKLLRPLGAGGMGAVWLADHTSLKTRVVVKFMLGDLGQSATARARFSREAEAAAKVKSPHVVQMFDHGVTEDGVPFIVMEYLEGRDLAMLITAKAGKDPLEPRIVIQIISQVAKALSKVHSAGLLHRDIKPDNIFLVEGEEDTYAKLLDFGIAKSHTGSGEKDTVTLDGETKTGQVIGTPFYMSPEQVTASKEIDFRSDLWALGVVTFEALTGQRPFDGPSFGALAVKIATGKPPVPSSLNPSLPPTFDEWFAKACAHDPNDRFANAKALAEELRAAFAGIVPVEAGAMSDSGQRSNPDPHERAGTPPRSVITPRPGESPISIDPAGVGDRPSFVLASTVEGTSGEGQSLARSAAGVSVGANTDANERRPPSMGLRVLGVLLLLGIVVAAFVVGLRSRNDPKPNASTNPIATQPPPSASVTTTAPPPPSVTLAIPSATIVTDAGPTAHPSATHTVTTAATGHPTGRPPPSATTTATATATTTARPPGSGDILF